MTGFATRLKKSRLALAAFGVLSTIAATTVTTTPALADNWRGERHWGHDGRDRDDDDRGWGRRERWEHERRIHEARERERERQEWFYRRSFAREEYLPPAYYAPSPYYYDQRGATLGFGFDFRGRR